MEISPPQRIYRRKRLLVPLWQFVRKKGRLLVIEAPVGYGKTVLLADFVQSAPWPVCWWSLHAVDRDPVACLSRLIDRLAERFHGFQPEPLLRLVQRQDIRGCTGQLAKQLRRLATPHLLIFDDYHKAAGSGLSLLLTDLLQWLPPTGRRPGELQRHLDEHDRRLIYDYLLDEIFRKQAPARQRFMLGTVLLEEISVEVANELLEITDAQEHIRVLVDQDLLSSTGSTFRYHDLPAEFLSNQWGRQSSSMQLLQIDSTHYRPFASQCRLAFAEAFLKSCW